jgi:hypothetical protein
MDYPATDLAGRMRSICLALPEVTELCQDAYRVTAPARLAALLHG